MKSNAQVQLEAETGGQVPSQPRGERSGYSRWDWMNVKNDLRPGWGPLQVATHADPQLVDVRVLPVVGRDGQGVRDGQQLGERMRGAGQGLRAQAWPLRPPGKHSE